MSVINKSQLPDHQNMSTILPTNIKTCFFQKLLHKFKQVITHSLVLMSTLYLIVK